ncbi:MAG TPA: two-component regulator propeller domain-containing protein [Bacteroidia bacterium]|nr:two-component regulator propeller domain-containing protein [Bacteroidia bacterium]
MDPFLKMRAGLKFIFLFVFLFSVRCFHVVSQTPVYKNYTVADGLPSQTVYSVMQDRKGYIWISTDAGVSRFDGVHFNNFTTNDGLSDNEIFYIFEDSGGKLWFITFNGKPCYFFNEKFFNPGNDTVLKKIKISGPLRSIYEDSRHNTWFGTSNSSVAYITAKGEVYNISLPGSFTSSRSVYFYEPGKKDFYIVFAGRFYSYNNNSFTEVKLPPVSVTNELAFCNISESKAAYVSDQGIELLVGKQFTHLTTNAKAEYLIVTIYYDPHNENIWLTSYQKGAVLLQKDESGNYNVMRTLLKEKRIIRVYSDNENNTWFASSGNGVYKLSSENFNLTSFTAQDGLEQSPVNCIKIDSVKNIWIGHNNGFLSRIDKEGKITKFDCSLNKKRYVRVIGIELDKQNNIWVGTDNGVLAFKSPIENDFENNSFIALDSNFIAFSFKAFAVDTQDNLTITYSHGVGKLNIQGKKRFFSSYNKAIPYERTYTHFFDHADNLWISNINGLCLLKNDSLIYYGLPDKTPMPRISNIGESRDSTLVLGTYGFGVLFFKNGKVINRFTEADGLAGNICKKIFINADTIYVASVGGLSRFVYRNNVITAIKKFTVSVGLLSTSVNDIVVDGETIYIATTEGVSILPVNLQNLQSVPPSVYITSLKVNGVPADTSKRINLNYQNQYLQFNFIAPVFDQPENTVYSYNISGHGNEWTETKNTAVEFSLLEPGEYIFSVRAKKDNSAWSDPARLIFFISPPYWKNAWFRLAAILFSFLIIYFIVFFRISRVKKAANEKTELNRKIAGLEMKALRAQMNPHFTFNVMNSIQNYIINNDSTSALRYLSKFAKLIRITLDNSQSPVIKLSEELTALEIYMELEKMRFKEKFEYEIIAGSDVDTSAIFIPSLLLQPYVENAIKHGIMDKRENGKVSVRINKNKNIICCVIEDNGVGRQKAEAMKNTDNENHHISLGSQIALHRVEAYNIANNSTIEVKVEDLKNEQNEAAGTRVLIHVPVK